METEVNPWQNDISLSRWLPGSFALYKKNIPTYNCVCFVLQSFHTFILQLK
jgi:hypothetical protein